VQTIASESSFAQLDQEKLRDELSCPICWDLLVQPVAPECGHAFCAKCLENWLGPDNSSCPQCRMPIRNAPRPVPALAGTVRLAAAGDAEYQERLQKALKTEKKRADAEAKLSRDVAKAEEAGKKFYRATKRWSTQWKDKFRRGIAPYVGRARTRYCELVGLSPASVLDATDAEVKVIAENLELDVQNAKGGMRSRLLQYIAYG
jgi:hypothetical protein